MDKIKQYIKDCSIGIGVILSYFLLPYTKYIVLYFLHGVEVNETLSILLSIVIEILTVSVILLLMNKRITKDFKEYFKYYLIGLAVMYISNAILMFGFDAGISGNEESIRSLLGIHPIYIYLSAVIIAPSVEELVFRGAIKNIIPNKILFILVSGLVFGGLHLVGNISNVVDLLYIIPYSALGIVFAYIYSKTDNIFVTMLLHTMHNGILVSLQIAVLLFG